MSLKEESKKIADCYSHLKDTLSVNSHLVDVYEGNLLPHVEAELRIQLSARAFQSCERRIPPINIEKKYIDKLSTIYSEPPRRIVSGSEADKEMWDWYLENFKIDVEMQVSNEYFNMHRGTALEPYLDNNFLPRLRALPRDRFFVYSKDMANPLNPTHFVKVMGKYDVKKYSALDKGYVGKELQILYVYTDEEFLIIDEEGDPVDELMAASGADGINPFGKIPFVYLNRSKTKINPPADCDLYQMTKLIPVMLTDVNYALMFQSFAIWYTIDVDDSQLQMNPNTVVSLKSDPKSDKKPEIGSIKPDLDSDKYYAAIQEQLALWLQTRGVRAGSVGQLQAENATSGLSKMVDEMDTTQERRKTTPFFSQAEQDLFNLVSKNMHPIWARNPSYLQKALFTKEATCSVEFKEQIVLKSRTELLDETTKELKEGLVSRETAMRRINPDLSEEEIEDEMERINKERTVEVPADEDGDEAPEIPAEP